MSDIIRAMTAPWTAPPGRSANIRIPSPPDTYSFLQNQIESAQRQGQNNMNRTIRAGNINAAPRAKTQQRGLSPAFPNVIITLPIR
jgi:hypothetical protein